MLAISGRVRVRGQASSGSSKLSGSREWYPEKNFPDSSVGLIVSYLTKAISGS